MKPFLIVFFTSLISTLLGQTELSEILDADYGVNGIVDLHALGIEDCDLIEVDEFYNQYVISHKSNLLEIYKINANGNHVEDYGINGKISIDSISARRLLKAKTYNEKLYVLIEDDNSMFLYGFTSSGKFDPDFGQGKRVLATNIAANSNLFELDILDNKILVASNTVTIHGESITTIDQFSFTGKLNSTDTISLKDNFQASLNNIKFRPNDEVFVVFYDLDPIDSIWINVRKYKNINTVDSSFAKHGTFRIPYDASTNFVNFKLNFPDNNIMLSYFVDSYFINHHLLNELGEVIYDHTELKIDSTETSFIYVTQSDISLVSDGYYVLEFSVYQNEAARYNFTKFTTDLKIDSTFGINGSYLISRIPRLRCDDNLERIYLTVRSTGYFKLVRTSPKILSKTKLELHKIDHFSVFPNPTNSIVNVTINNKGQIEYRYNVYNIHGELMFTQHSRTSNFTIDLSSLSSGIYFINMVAKHKSISKLVIKN